MKYKPLKVSTLLIFASFLPYSAHAEDTWDFVQVICGKNLGYFKLETTSFVEGIAGNKPEESSNNMFSPRILIKKPFACTIPKPFGSTESMKEHTITAEVVDYIASNYPGDCGLSSHFNILLHIDGKQTYKFSAYGQNRCEKAESHIVEIKNDKIRDCTLPEFLSGNTEAGCKTIDIK